MQKCWTWWTGINDQTSIWMERMKWLLRWDEAGDGPANERQDEDRLLMPQIMFKPLWVYRNMQAGGYSSSAHELQNCEYKGFILTHLWTPGAKCFAHSSVDTPNLEHSTCFSWSNLHDTFCWVSPHLRPLPIVKTTGGTTGGEWSAL